MSSKFTRPSDASSKEAPETTEISKEAALSNEVLKARQLIPDEVSAKVLPPDAVVTRLDKELFQSSTFQDAAYSEIPDRYGKADRSLITVTLATGEQVFIIGGKVSSGNPYEVGHAAMRGMDLRQSRVTVYAYDGAETITEYMGGESNSYTGENGTPAALLHHARQALGTPVGTETY